MAKIKNDPSKYVRRSTLAGRRSSAADEKADQVCRKRERDFMTAPIDDNFYMDLRVKPVKEDD